MSKRFREKFRYVANSNFNVVEDVLIKDFWMTRSFQKCDLNFLILLLATIHVFGNIPRGLFEYLLS